MEMFYELKRLPDLNRGEARTGSCPIKCATVHATFTASN